MFLPEMDAIKYFLCLLILTPLPGLARQFPDTLKVHLPDTSLNAENSLFLLEQKTGVYFSFNPEIFSREKIMVWKEGEIALKEILDSIANQQGLRYTPIGNQVVFHREGEVPVIPGERGDRTEPIPKIRGRILGLSSGEPLPYATVWIPSIGEGTMANSEGWFMLKTGNGNPADSVAFGYMGYKTRYRRMGELKDSLNIISLETSFIPIQEVVIRRADPLHLLRQAVDKIPENSMLGPLIEKAFYRETIQKDDRYVSVSEAVIEVYKPALVSGTHEQVKVLKGRKNRDLSEMDTLMVKLKGGLETSFLLDAVRNRPDFLREELFHLYNYRMSDIVVIQDRSSYAIDFFQKENTPPPHYRGRIYIDLENLAIRGVEFEVIPGTLHSIAGSLIYRKPRQVKVRPLSASYMVRYKSDGGQFFLSMIRADNRFRVRPRKKLFGNEFRTVSEMAVTAIQTKDVNRFRLKETANSMDIFSDLLGGYDPEFWGPYNTILPEESLEDALIRIGKLLQSQ